MDDAELLEVWRDGDRVAGNALFERHFTALYRFFRGKVSHGADDLIQQTFAACVEGRERIAPGGFRAYLFGIARNMLYTRFRQQRSGVRFDATVTRLEDLTPSPSRVVDRKAQDKLLATALRRIPLELQIALELHYWEDLSTGELASILEIPRGTVKSRLRRAKEEVREQMQQLGASAVQADSTMSDLQKWALAVRDQVQDPDGDG